jgi:hypothetical protein
MKLKLTCPKCKTIYEGSKMDACDCFDDGVACCTSWLIKAHGGDGLALEMLHEMGISLKRVDSYDRKIIQKVVKDDSRYKIVDNKLTRIYK